MLKVNENVFELNRSYIKSNVDDFSSIKEIYISKSVKKITSNFFNYFKSLNKIIIDKDNPYFYAEDNVIYDKKKETLLFYLFNKPEEDFIVPEGITIIETFSFNKTKNLKTVHLPASLNLIRPHSFYQCQQLEQVYLKNTSTRLASECMPSYVLKKSVHTMGTLQASKCTVNNFMYYIILDLFYNVDKESSYYKNWASFFKVRISTFFHILNSLDFLKYINSEAKDFIEDFNPEDFTTHLKLFVQAINEAPFDSSIPVNDNYTRINLPNSSYEWTEDQYIRIIDKDLTYLPKKTFNRCDYIHGVIIPNTVKRVDFNFICRCKNLDDIILNDHPFFFLDNNILYDKRDLSILNIPTNLQSKVTILDGVKYIPTAAFAYKNNVCEIELPNSVEDIGVRAFVDCKDLSILKIPGDKVHLKSVTVPFKLLLNSLEYINPKCLYYQFVKKFKEEIEDIIRNGNMSEDYKKEWEKFGIKIQG